MREHELLALLDGRLKTKILVHRMDREIAQAIRARTDAVYLSRWTIEKQMRRHPDIWIGHYMMLPVVLAHGLAVQDTPRSCVFVYSDIHIFGCHFKAVVKSDTPGHEMYVQSFHVLGKRQFRSLRRKNHPTLRGHWWDRAV